MNNDKRVTSVDEYLKIIFEKANRSDIDTDMQLFWFRGESNIEFKTPLVPCGYRVLADTFKDIVDDRFNSDHIRKLERNISAEFERKALPYIISKGIENSPWNRYFLMQHYKIYTRLLDWTENALLALFFAICENQNKDAKVWILQPFNLNDFAVKTLVASDSNFNAILPPINPGKQQKLINEKGELRLEELARRYLRMDFNQKEIDGCDKTYYPVAMYPPFLDCRMSAQKACFTIFGNKINGLLSVPNEKESVLDYIIVASERKRFMMKELRLMGIDFDSIFPDLDGLGRSINGIYEREFLDNRETIMHIVKEKFPELIGNK